MFFHLRRFNTNRFGQLREQREELVETSSSDKQDDLPVRTDTRAEHQASKNEKRIEHDR